MKDFKGKVPVVTGGASGINFSFCKSFVKEGAKIIPSDINISAATEKAREMGVITANVGKEVDTTNLLEKTIEIYGQIDLFLPNANIAFPADEKTGKDIWGSYMGFKPGCECNSTCLSCRI